MCFQRKQSLRDEEQDGWVGSPDGGSELITACPLGKFPALAAVAQFHLRRNGNHRTSYITVFYHLYYKYIDSTIDCFILIEAGSESSQLTSFEIILPLLYFGMSLLNLTCNFTLNKITRRGCKHWIQWLRDCLGFPYWGQLSPGAWATVWAVGYHGRMALGSDGLRSNPCPTPV